MLDKMNYVLGGEQGASNVEIIVWISVVLVIATVLFLFRDAIMDFIDRATGQVNALQVEDTPTP